MSITLTKISWKTFEAMPTITVEIIACSAATSVRMLEISFPVRYS